MSPQKKQQRTKDILKATFMRMAIPKNMMPAGIQ